MDRVGFPLDHPYLERVDCSVLGPTSVLLLRRVGELLAEHPHGVTVDLGDLSRSLAVVPIDLLAPAGVHVPTQVADAAHQAYLARPGDPDNLVEVEITPPGHSSGMFRLGAVHRHPG